MAIEISRKVFMEIFKMLLIFNFLLVQKSVRYNFQGEGWKVKMYIYNKIENKHLFETNEFLFGKSALRSTFLCDVYHIHFRSIVKLFEVYYMDLKRYLKLLYTSFNNMIIIDAEN